jgi:dynein-related subfamily AAA family protein
MIPNNITKEHLEKAIEEIDKNGIRKGRQSSTYNLVHNGKHYPPKLIISIANKYANGIELDSSEFEGGMETPAFKLLESFDYKIIEKKNLKDVIIECQFSFSEIKQDYKNDYDQVFNREKDWLNNIEEKTYRLSESVRDDVEYVITKLKDESYIFKNTDTDKLSIFISQINGIIRVANRINNFKEGTELDNNQRLKLFELFNKIKSTDRFVDFDFPLNKNLKSFIVHLYSVVKHCQSPDNYPVYYKYWKNILGEVLKQNDDYDNLCSFYQTIDSPKHLSLGAYFGTIGTILARKITENQLIKEEDDKNYKYIRNKILNIHYFDLITGYKRNPNYYIIGSKYGENNDEDVFPKMLENKVVSVGFASHIDLSDFYLTDSAEIVEYLKDENEARNSCNALKLFLNIKTGDKVAIKASGSPKRNKGFLSIVGIFEVVQDEDSEVYNYAPEGLGHTLNVKVIDAPLYREFELGGYGSTVHKLSKKDHISQIFSQINNSDSPFLETKNKFNTTNFANYIKFLRKINSELNLQANDERVVYSVRDNRLNFTVGQRYCFNLYLNESRGIYGVISKEKLNASSEPYDGNPPQPFYGYFKTFNPNLKESDSIIEAIKDELSRTSKSGFRRHNNSDFENYVFEIANETITNEDNMKLSLNTILYGPPGTGKTYNTILRAAQIIENRVIDSYNEALEIFKANLHNRIEFITFHQNYSYEDFIQGLRPDTENDNQLTFERKDGVFKEIADKALKNLTESEKPQLSKRPFEEVFNQFINPLVEGEVEEIEVKMKKVSYFITAISNKSIDFRKASGGTAHTLSIGTLKKMYLAESVLEIQGLASYYTPLLGELLKLGKDSSGKKEKIKRQNYVIIIDEINRANISRVFGELITLIEPDKRSHGAIPLEARLPSGDPFIVPSNLFIIGTMNTADKSIALLDIALRRRFEFESMYPKYTEDGINVNDENVLKSINQSIIADKGHDFQIGHSYFMDSKEDPYDFERRMNVKVIPLLLEYFMNDSKAVTQIISKALNNTTFKIDDNSWPLKISVRND